MQNEIEATVEGRVGRMPDGVKNRLVDFLGSLLVELKLMDFSNSELALPNVAE